MRLWTTPSYTSVPARGTGRRASVRSGKARQVGHAGEPRHAGHARVAPWGAAEAGREGPHHLLLQLTGGAVGIPDRGEDEVRHRLRGLLRAGSVDGRGADGEIHQLALPVDDGLYQAAAGRAFHFSIG